MCLNGKSQDQVTDDESDDDEEEESGDDDDKEEESGDDDEEEESDVEEEDEEGTHDDDSVDEGLQVVSNEDIAQKVLAQMQVSHTESDGQAGKAFCAVGKSPPCMFTCDKHDMVSVQCRADAFTGHVVGIAAAYTCCFVSRCPHDRLWAVSMHYAGLWETQLTFLMELQGGA